MAKAYNYTSVLKHKERIKIQYTDLEVRGRLELYGIIFISIIFSLPFSLLNIYAVVIVFLISFSSIIITLQFTDENNGTNIVKVYFLNFTNKKYILNTKHFKENRYIKYKPKKYKLSKQIYLLDYKGG